MFLKEEMRNIGERWIFNSVTQKKRRDICVRFESLTAQIKLNLLKAHKVQQF